MLREYKDEIEKLRQMLTQAGLTPPLKKGGSGEGSESQDASSASANVGDGALRRGSVEESEAAIRERDLVREELRRKEEEVAEERAQREELHRRLVELQGKLTGSGANNDAEAVEDAEEAKQRRKERLVHQESKRLEIENEDKKHEVLYAANIFQFFLLCI